MRTALAATCVVVGTLLAPLAVHAADNMDKDRSSPKDFVKDSAITIQIKAKLAEEKLDSALHIKVDTDNKGAVLLSGTAKTQAEVNKAGEIARGVQGVVSVRNTIKVAGASAPASGGTAAAPTSGKTSGGSAGFSGDRVEARIKDLHARLKITQPQEDQWSKVAETMRENGKKMDTLTKSRAEMASMNAIDDLKSYGEITDAHADGIKRFTPVFKTLYDSMSDAQKKTADEVFRRGGRKAT